MPLPSAFSGAVPPGIAAPAAFPHGGQQPFAVNTVPAMASLRDNFYVSDLSALWGGSTGTVTISGGQCAIKADTAYDSALVSGTGYNLSGSYMFARITPYQATDAQTFLSAQINAGNNNNCAQIYYSGNSMNAQVIQGGVTNYLGFITYSALAHAWWRIREQSGMFYFGLSPDGITWTEPWSAAHTIPAGSLTVEVNAGDFGSDPVGTTYVASFNIPGTPPNAVTGTAVVKGRRGRRGGSSGSPAPLLHITHIPEAGGGALVAGRRGRHGTSKGSPQPLVRVQRFPASAGASVAGRKGRRGGSAGSPEVIPSVTSVPSLEYVGPYPVTYLQYLGPGGTLSVTPGETVAMTQASGWPYAVPIPPHGSTWLVNGMLYRIAGGPRKERVPESGFSIHDAYCGLCLRTHWEAECPPPPPPRRKRD